MPDAAAMFDAADARLLDLVQQEIPYVQRPFQELGRQAGLDEAQCLTRLQALKQRGVIRQISAIFDTKALGYESSLVTGRYDPDHLDQAALIVGQHPGVSHNYKRNHAYNLWYTLAVPPDSRLGLVKTIDLIHRLSGAQVTRPLPTLKLYKIGVKLNLSGQTDPTGKAENHKAFDEQDRQKASEYVLSEQDKRLILVLQRDMAIVAEPFASMGEAAQCTPEELWSACRRFELRRQMRRFSAVLHHREAGFKANVMGVWKIDPAQADQYGQVMARFQAVSHCYLRPTYEDWPYNIYTMVHGQSRQEAQDILQGIQRETRIQDYVALWSMKEYKKVRVEYFTTDNARWEATHLDG